MSRSLTRFQAAILGLIVIATLGVGAWGMTRMGMREGFFRETFQVRVGFAEVHDVGEGTPVRVRGVPAGQVVAVEYPTKDAPDGKSLVWLRMELDQQFRGRLYDDATAKVYSRGLMNSSVIAIDPGSPNAGPLQGDVIPTVEEPGLADVTGRLYDVADRADRLLEEIHTSDGTFAKLLREDDLYRDIEGFSGESRELVRGARDAVMAFQKKLDGMEEFMRVGQATVEAVKQDAEAIKRLPIVRSYVEDPTAVMKRPDCDREQQIFDTEDLFEPNSAILHPSGKARIYHAANWLKMHKDDDSEVSVVAFVDPTNTSLTPAYAKSLTQKQCEVVVAELRAHGAHKLGWFSRRDIKARGFGFSPPPVIEKEKPAPNNVQILLFIPRE